MVLWFKGQRELNSDASHTNLSKLMIYNSLAINYNMYPKV